MLELIAFDADDTLWHCETHFAEAQCKFKSMMQKYLQDDYNDRHLFETETRNLGHYGYGVKSFGLSMIESAVELTQGRISVKDIQALVELTKEMLEAPVQVFPKVEEALARLSDQYVLMVISKGDLFDQENKLARSGLGDFFHDIEVVSEKDTHTYRKILYKYGLRSRNFMMVGNSLRSDILPVVEIGASAVYIPYANTWAYEQVQLDESKPKPFIELASITELPDWLDARVLAA